MWCRPARYAGADIVVISHLHWDHLDLPSIRQLVGDPIVVVPMGAGELLRRNGATSVVEMVPGDTATFGGVRVTATKAVHRGFRPPFGPDAPSLGFVLEDPDRRIYFAGDTDIFPEMAELGELDLALLPIWGWGPRLGPGHMDPYRAAEALKLLRPRVAVPIHWGTYWLRGGGRLAQQPPDPPAARVRRLRGHQRPRRARRRGPARGAARASALAAGRHAGGVGLADQGRQLLGGRGVDVDHQRHAEIDGAAPARPTPRRSCPAGQGRAGRRGWPPGRARSCADGTASGRAWRAPPGGQAWHSRRCAPNRSPDSAAARRDMSRSRTTLATIEAQAIE